MSEEKNLIKKIVDRSIPSENYFCDEDLDKKFKTELMELEEIAMEDYDCERVYFSNGMLTVNLKTIVKA